MTGPGLLRWTGGTLAGTNTVLAGTGCEISGAVAKTLDIGARLENFTTVTWLDAGMIHCGYGAVWANAGVFDAQNDSAFYMHTGGSPVPRFENTGTLRKSAGTLTRFLANNGGMTFTNAGTVDIRAGVLSLASLAYLGPGGTFTGDGLTSLDYDATLYGTSHLNNGHLRLTATLNANSGLDGTGTFEWRSGTLNGHLDLGAGVTLDLPGDSSKALSPEANLTHHGLATLSGAGNLYLGWGANWNNHGTFEARTNGILYKHTGGVLNPAFNNYGTFRKLASAGTTEFRPENGGVTFNNAGLLDLRSGTLQINSTYLQGAGASSAFLLSGPAAGTGYGSVGRNGLFLITGPFTVTLASGYTPAVGTVFTLANYATFSGNFNPVSLPPLPSPLQWSLAYKPTSLELRVLAGAPWLQLSQPAWPGPGVFQSVVFGSNVNAVVVQATTDFSTWTPVVTNTPFTGTFPFADTNAGAFSNRFYRAQELP